jgi:DNA invertase Pin-like site-specific DNA recombinase
MTRRPSRSRPQIDFESLRGMRVRSYVRESHPRQAEADRYGPDLQRKGIVAFCDRWGIPHPEKEYFDAATARHVDRRHGLQQALEEANAYDALLIFHSSRSFRNRHDAAIWKTKFRQADVLVVFTEQGIISGDRRFKVVEGVNELMDELYSDTQGMFISSGLRQKFEKGGVNGVPPLGYRRFHGVPGDPMNGNLIVDERGRRTVRAMVELYLSGQHSVSSIAMRLNADFNEEGQPLHRTRLGRPLTKGSVEEVLRNRVYTGVTVWQPGTPEEEIRPGNHEAIVTDAEWKALERIRIRRTTRRGRRPVGRVYPLSGPARCFHCGGSFAGDTGGRRGKRRLRHAVSVICPNRRSFAADHVESQMARLLTARFRLPQDWHRKYLRALAAGVETGSTPGKTERGVWNGPATT